MCLYLYICVFICVYYKKRVVELTHKQIMPRSDVYFVYCTCMCASVCVCMRMCVYHKVT